jgi:hypothetical protein
MSGRPTENSRGRAIVSPLAEHRRHARVQPSPIPTIYEEDENRQQTPEERELHDPGNPDDFEIPDNNNNNYDNNDEDDDDDGEQPNLAIAIGRLNKTLQNQKKDREGSGGKIRDPDQFDGQDPKKLRIFLVQLELNFSDRPTVFRRDRTKVNYALSYLKGTALEWFEPALYQARVRPNIEPAWRNDWEVFAHELRTNFGPHDPVGEAESELERLQMKETHHIMKYNVDFTRISSQLYWGEPALRHRYYRGLPARIKDEISRIGKPVRLAELRTLAQNIDARYWERRAEISREAPPTKNPGSTKPTSDAQDKPSSSSSSHKSQGKKPENSDRSSQRSAPNRSSQALPATRNPELQGKLGKDGKLTAEERQRRFDNKLCMFCGGTGHMARDCTKRNAKARSSTTKTTETATVAESSDSKK